MKYNNNLIWVDRFENLMTAKEGRIKTLRRKQKSRTYQGEGINIEKGSKITIRRIPKTNATEKESVLNTTKSKRGQKKQSSNFTHQPTSHLN